jgi:hypothetical protein
MENMYYLYCGRLQQAIDENHKWAETFGPRKKNRLERAMQRRLEQFNLCGFIVHENRERKEDNSEQHEISILGRWPWDYPKYNTDRTTLRKWEGTKKFHNLMWDMQKYYEDKTWQLFKKNRLYLPISI